MNVVDVDAEYKNFRNQYKADPSIYDEDRFWMKIKNTKTGDGSLKFPLVLSLYDKIRILSHSSACCERIFSAVNLNGYL